MLVQLNVRDVARFFSSTAVVECFCFETVVVPVHVRTNSQITEEDFITQLNDANAIVDDLIRTSDDVKHLRHLLQQDNINPSYKAGYRNELRELFKAAMHQKGISLKLASAFAVLRVYNTATDIELLMAKHGDSIVVYFRCKTLKALYELYQMIVSGFMHAVFAAAIQSLARTTVDVYVRADEFNFTLLSPSFPPDTGKSVIRQQLLTCILYRCIR